MMRQIFGRFGHENFSTEARHDARERRLDEFFARIDEHTHFAARGRRGGGFGRDEHGHHHNHPGFGGRGPGDFEDFGRGRGRGRMFDSGDLKLVILRLLSDQPSYGYQLIKTMEEQLGGGYKPSAGVIYPTLTLLEEEDLASSSMENGKKVYSVTDAGRAYLEAQRLRVGELFSRMEEEGRRFDRARSPELMRAFMMLRQAVIDRASRGNPSNDHIRQMTEIIEAAARSIDEL